jgi:hypothetical protein
MQNSEICSRVMPTTEKTKADNTGAPPIVNLQVGKVVDDHFGEVTSGAAVRS